MRTKEIILTGLMMLLLAACSSSSDNSDVVPEPNNGNGNDSGNSSYEQSQRAIGFVGFFADDEGGAASARSTRGAMRRAGETPEPGEGEFTTADLQRSGFGVYCWYTGSSDFTTAYASTTVLMLNQKVEYKNDLWTYSPSKYWPLNDNDKLTFRAYAPYVSYQLQTAVATGLPMLPVVVTAEDYHKGTQHDPLWGTGRLVNGTEYNPLPDPADEEALKEYYRYGTLYDNITYEMSGDNRLKETLPADTRNGYIDWYFHHGMSKLMFTCSVIKDPGCDRVVIRSITIENLYTQGLLSLSSLTGSASEKPTWDQKAGNMSGDDAVILSEATPDNTKAGDLAPIPEDPEHPENPHSTDPYPFVITTSKSDATPSIPLLSHGLLIIPRDFHSPNQPLKITIGYSIDSETEIQKATAEIDDRTFEGNTSYTLKMNLTPSTRGLEISLVQGAFTPWKTTVEGTHEVYNW